MEAECWQIEALSVKVWDEKYGPQHEGKWCKVKGGRGESDDSNHDVRAQTPPPPPPTVPHQPHPLISRPQNVYTGKSQYVKSDNVRVEAQARRLTWRKLKLVNAKCFQLIKGFSSYGVSYHMPACLPAWLPAFHTITQTHQNCFHVLVTNKESGYPRTLE